MPKVGEAYYELTAREEKLLQALGRAEGKITASGRTAETAFGGGVTGSLDKTGGHVDVLGNRIGGLTATTGRFGGVFKSLGTGILQGIGIGAFMGVATAVQVLIGSIGRAISAASAMNETVSKVGVVFGAEKGRVLAWGESAAVSMGMSKQAALEAAGTFGNLFVSMKIGAPVAADMSTKLIGLAGDLASFNNVDPTEALEALRSGLVGETEPLRRFGVNLNEATLAQKALELGLISSTKEALTPAVKAQAAYALILDQTRTAQGDFARTSSGLANQQRIAAAQVEDAFAKLGQALLPLAAKIVPAVAGAIVWLAERLGVLFDVIGQVLDFLRPLADILGPPLQKAIEGLGVAFNFIGAVIRDTLALFKPVGDALQWLSDRIDELQGRTHESAGKAQDDLDAVTNAVKSNVGPTGRAADELGAALEEPITKKSKESQKSVYDSMTEIVKSVRDTRQKLSEIAQGMLDTVFDPIEAAANEAAASQALADNQTVISAGGAADTLAKIAEDRKAIAEARTATEREEAEKQLAIDSATAAEEVQTAQDTTWKLTKELLQRQADVASYGDETTRIAGIKAFLASDAIRTAYANATPEQKKELDAWTRQFGVVMADEAAKAGDFGWQVGDRYRTGLSSQAAAVSTAATIMVGGIPIALAAVSDGAYTAGYRVGSSLAAGMNDAADLVEAAAAGFTTITASYTRLYSPAKKGAWSQGGGPEGYGERFGILLARGLEHAAGIVEQAARRITEVVGMEAAVQGMARSVVTTPAGNQISVSSAAVNAAAFSGRTGSNVSIGDVNVRVDVERLDAADPVAVTDLARKLGNEVRLSLTRSPAGFALPVT